MRLAALCFAAVMLAACSGNFGTGTGIPQQGGMPPIEPSTMPANNAKGLPEGMGMTPPPEPSPGVYAIADAQSGFACPPTVDEYSCRLSFNLPPPTPSPSSSPKGKHTTSPSPSPSPSPTPVPSGSGSPSPSPTAGSATVTLNAEAMPSSAPKMVHVPQNTLNVDPLMMVTLNTNADFPLDGWVNAEFTLPKDQVSKDRGFAVQLFSRTTKKRGVNYSPIWTFDKSTIDGTMLTFSFKPPKMKIPKNSTYVLVLYGDKKSSTAASPAPSATASPAATATASPAPSASPAE